MSLEKLAKALYVDEVLINHGPKGVAVHVRVADAWQSAAIDNDELGKGKRRLEVIAEHLLFLADGYIHKMWDLRKSQADGATRAALQAEAAAVQQLSWRDVSWERPTDGFQRQVQRVEPMAASWTSPLIEPPPEPAVSESMPSRFHAVMAELESL